MSNKIRLTRFRSAKEVNNGKTMEFEDFEEVCKYVGSLEIGEKAGYGFTRGQMTSAVRLDKNATTSRVLIIDADISTNGKLIDPESAHNALTLLGFNHCIYTSWSHNQETNKYRILIECQEYKKENLDNLNRSILRDLKSVGIDIKYVKEMKAWSQIWYEPRREKDDGLFEFYQYIGGSEYSFEEIVESKSEYNVEKEIEGLEDLYENIRTGKEFHSSLRTISFQLIKDGMSDAHCINVLKTLMNGSMVVGSDRWEERYKDIERLVKGVSKDEEEFKLDEIVQTTIDSPIPSAPGLLGQMMKEAMETMRYKGEDKLAFVSIVFLISSIVGRKFNVDIETIGGIEDGIDSRDPTALNTYLTLIAPTGYGKDQIKSVIRKLTLQSAGLTSGPDEFIYMGRDTSLSPIYRKISKIRSMGFLTGEAGVSAQSKLGDVEGLKSFWLGVYGHGNFGGVTDSIGRSKAEDDMPGIKQAAVSRLGESTEVELFKAYRMSDVMENGVITRESVFKIVTPNMEKNKNRRTRFSSEVISCIRHITEEARIDVEQDNPVTHFITALDEKMQEDSDETQAYYRKIQTDPSQPLTIRAMCSRLHVKGLRFAGISCVINNRGAKTPLVMSRRDFDWGMSMAKYEEKLLMPTFSGMSGNDQMDEGIRDVYNAIYILLSGQSKNKRAKLTQFDLDRKFISNSKLKESLKNSAALSAMTSDATKGKYIAGYDKCIDEMCKQGWIRRHDSRYKGKAKGIVVNATLKEVAKMINEE